MQSTMNSQRQLRCCLLGHALKLGTRQIYNNLTKIQHISVSVGLTPAHTGNTSMRISAVWGFSAHPRTYGEHLPAPGVPDSQIGSSPHIRGTQVPVSHVAGANRLIPAHTGNTHSTGTQPAPKAAHPRTYGEHLQGYRLTRPGRGSSPHIRGTHLATRHDTRAKSKKYLVSTRIHI